MLFNFIITKFTIIIKLNFNNHNFKLSEKEEKLRNVLQDERLQEVINNILEIGVDELKSNQDTLEEIDLHKVDEIRRLMETTPEFADFAHLCLQSLGIRDSKGHCIL